MPQTLHDRTLALAGLFQACHLVRDLAQTGRANEHDIATCLESVFRIDAPSSAAVYGGVDRLRTGLTTLVEQLRRPRDTEIPRYLINLLTLERSLARHPDSLQRIGQQLSLLAVQLDQTPAEHPHTIARLADLYTQTLSLLKPRIMVRGERDHLNNIDVTQRIRALLLAGVRSAVLWRQSGGGRFTLLLARGRFLTEADALLNTLS